MKQDDIIEETRKMIKREFAHKHYPIINYEDLVSEAFLWLSAKGRLEKIEKIARESGELVFYSYLRTSLSKLFSRYAINELVRRSYNNILSSDNLDVFNSRRSQGDPSPYLNLMSYEDFKDWIRLPGNGFKVLSDSSLIEYLTPIQREALFMVTVEGKTNRACATELNISPQNFNDRLTKALKNIFVSQDFQKSLYNH